MATRRTLYVGNGINDWKLPVPVPFQCGLDGHYRAWRADEDNEFLTRTGTVRAEFAHSPHFVPVYIPGKSLNIGAGDRARTGTGLSAHGILSPGRLPVPPLRRLGCYCTNINTLQLRLRPRHLFAARSIPVLLPVRVRFHGFRFSRDCPD